MVARKLCDELAGRGISLHSLHPISQPGKRVIDHFPPILLLWEVQMKYCQLLVTFVLVHSEVGEEWLGEAMVSSVPRDSSTRRGYDLLYPHGSQLGLLSNEPRWMAQRRTYCAQV